MNAAVYVLEEEESHCTSTRQMYRVWHEGEIFMEGVKDPIHEAARELIALGAHVDDRIAMFKRGSDRLSMRGRIGFLAAHRTNEGEMSGPRIGAYVPYTGPETVEE